MSSIFIDLTGTVYGRLTVLSYYGVKGHETMWNCRCSCGNTKIIAKSSLIRGTKSCGCLLKEINSRRSLIDLTGKVFGRWTVLERDFSTGKHVHWFCKCECGTIRSVWNQSLKNGESQSCGCYKRDSAIDRLSIDITNIRFGRLVAFECINKNVVGDKLWRCKCDCGNEKIVKGIYLRIGDTQSCGCIHKEIMSAQIGKLNPSWKGGKTKTKNGYILIRMPYHPNANQSGYVKEHIYVMSLKVGRPLIKGETVHHKNGIRSDNRIENLELWASSHGGGQRVDDLIPHWIDMLKIYKPDALNQNLIGV